MFSECNPIEFTANRYWNDKCDIFLINQNMRDITIHPVGKWRQISACRLQANFFALREGSERFAPQESPSQDFPMSTLSLHWRILPKDETALLFFGCQREFIAKSNFVPFIPPPKAFDNPSFQKLLWQWIPPNKKKDIAESSLNVERIFTIYILTLLGYSIRSSPVNFIVH